MSKIESSAPARALLSKVYPVDTFDWNLTYGFDFLQSKNIIFDQFIGLEEVKGVFKKLSNIYDDAFFDNNKAFIFAKSFKIDIWHGPSYRSGTKYSRMEQVEFVEDKNWKWHVLLKGYLRCKMITSQNVQSVAQVNNFFIS